VSPGCSQRANLTRPSAGSVKICTSKGYSLGDVRSPRAPGRSRSFTLGSKPRKHENTKFEQRRVGGSPAATALCPCDSHFSEKMFSATSAGAALVLIQRRLFASATGAGPTEPERRSRARRCDAPEDTCARPLREAAGRRTV